VPPHKHAPFVALLTLLQRRFPDLDEAAQLISEGVVLVNSARSTNPWTRVRADAAVRIQRPRPLRGTIKLAHALRAFGVCPTGVAALDLGLRQAASLRRSSTQKRRLSGSASATG
jgi:predicted rRNA methylase YqxC with S4 and FtsJ domains